MAAINNLYLEYAYQPGKTALPILIVMHGYVGNATTPGDTMMRRCALHGAFVCSVGLRGRNSADGTQDDGRREIYDIYDAVQWVRANFSAIVNSDVVGLLGYSQGGGHALACGCKFPDTFAGLFDFFGISDYGVDGTDGWYFNEGSTEVSQADIESHMGGTPAAAPNNYKSNDAVSAILNYSGGHLYLYHDDEDVAVPIVHSTRIKAVLDGAGRTNYTANFSDALDSDRWEHGPSPNNVPDLAIPEETFVTYLKTASAWTIPASGTITVIGYIVTKRFTIWLRAHGSTTYGLDAAATVVYDTATDTYTVTPTTGAIDVTVTQGAKAGSASNIAVETAIVVT